jgi:hypothetical protein
VLLASGPAAPDATEFTLTATVGSEVHGILSNPFLDQAFRTLSYRIQVTINDDGTWSYEEEGVLQIPGRDKPFSHIDHNTLTRIGPPELNPLARAAGFDRHRGGQSRHRIVVDYLKGPGSSIRPSTSPIGPGRAAA